jgi:hypothetical protein
MNNILKGTSPEDQAAIIRLVEKRGTYDDLMNKSLQGKADEVHKWFDDLFQVVDDPELKAAIQKDFKYTENYIPYLTKEYKKVASTIKIGTEEVSRAPEMLKATERASGLRPSLTVKQMVTRFLNPRKGQLPDEIRNLNLENLMKTYLYGIKKTAFDLPAYQEAMGVLKKVPEGALKNEASWYLNNYIGQPGDIKDSGMYEVAKAIRNRMYSALIGLKASIPTLNLSQFGLLGVEAGGRNAAVGAAKSVLPKYRKAADAAGYFNEYPGIEGNIKGKIDKIVNYGMEQSERALRTGSHVAGLRQAEQKGLQGAQINPNTARKGRDFFYDKYYNPVAKNAADVTRKTQFIYGAESPIRWATEHPLLSMFTSYPTKNVEFQMGIVKDALTKGGRENWGKLGRLMAYDTAFGVPIVVTARRTAKGQKDNAVTSAVKNTIGLTAPLDQYRRALVRVASEYASATGKDKGDKLKAFEKAFKESWRYLMPGGDATVRFLEGKKKK